MRSWYECTVGPEGQIGRPGQLSAQRLLRSTPTFSYQWYAGGKQIAGAAKTAFKVTVAQKGKQIAVAVTATKTGHVTLATTSKATAKVKNDPWALAKRRQGPRRILASGSNPRWS